MKARINRTLSKGGFRAFNILKATVDREYGANIVGCILDVTLVPKYASVESRRELWATRVSPKKDFFKENN